MILNESDKHEILVYYLTEIIIFANPVMLVELNILLSLNYEEICKDCENHYTSCRCEYCDDCKFRKCLCELNLIYIKSIPKSYSEKERNIIRNYIFDVILLQKSNIQFKIVTYFEIYKELLTKLTYSERKITLNYINKLENINK